MEVDNAEVRETILAGSRGESFGGWRSLTSLEYGENGSNNIHDMDGELTGK